MVQENFANEMNIVQLSLEVSFVAARIFWKAFNGVLLKVSLN